MFKKLLGSPSKEKDLVIGAPQHFEKKTQETLDSLPEDLRNLLSISGINDDQRKKFPTQTIRALQLHKAIAEGNDDAPARPTRSAKAQAARREAMMKARSDKALASSQTVPPRQPLSPRATSASPTSPRSATAPQPISNDADLPLEELVNSVLTDTEASSRYPGLGAAGPRSDIVTYKDESVRVRRVAVPTHAAGRSNLRSDLLVVQAMGAHPHLAEYRTSHLVRGPNNTESLWIVCEPLDGEPLADVLDDQGGLLGLSAIAAILKGVLSALEHIHSRDLVLQDLRVGGLYIASDGTVKLLDTLPRPAGCFAYWLAPEAILTNSGAIKGDTWSVGVLAAELLEGKAPYSGMQPAQAYLQIATEGRLTLKTAISSADQKQLKDFIDKCTIKDPNDRPTEKDLLAHPFLKLATAASNGELARLVRQLRGARGERTPSLTRKPTVIQLDEWPAALLQTVATDLGVAPQSKTVKDTTATATTIQLEKAIEHIDLASVAEVEKQLAASEAQRQSMLTELCRREVEACKQRYGTAIRDIIRELDRREQATK